MSNADREYSADHLEQHVLDPLFYRYEGAIRAQSRLERELSLVRLDCRKFEQAKMDMGKRVDVCNDEIDSLRLTIEGLEGQVKATRSRSIELEPKLKALYDNAKDILVELRGTKQRKGMAVVASRLQAAVDNLHSELEIPF